MPIPNNSVRALVPCAVLVAAALLACLSSAARAQDATGYFPDIEKITYLGAKHLTDEDLNTIAGWRVAAGDTEAAKAACAKIVEKYHQLGRPFATCVLLKGGAAGDTEVVFQITEGPRVTIKAVQFTGNAFVSAAVLKSRLTTVNDPAFATLDLYHAQTAADDGDKIADYYKGHGFLDVAVTHETQWDADGRNVTLIYHIKEGTRCRVKDVPQPVNNRAVSTEIIQRLSKVKAGDYYDRKVIEDDVSRITDYYGAEGRNVKIEVVPLFPKETPGVVVVEYQIEEKPPAYVGEIRIIGSRLTPMPVVTEEIEVYPAQLLAHPDLAPERR
jgi:outer membrane protein insertion porin family